jgi:hypothetical protein
MPLAITRQTENQIIEETKSATYPRIEIVKAAITCTAKLNGANAIDGPLGVVAFSEEFCTDVRLAGDKTEICAVVNTFTSFFCISPSARTTERIAPLFGSRPKTSSLIVIWMAMAPVPVILLLFVVPGAVLVIFLVSFC